MKDDLKWIGAAGFLMFILIWLIFVIAAVKSEAHDWVKADGTKVNGSWIMNNKKTRYCCGKQDCMPVTGLAYFDPIVEGWRVKGWKGYLKLGSEHIRYGTPDGNLWACYRRKYASFYKDTRDADAKYTYKDKIIRCLWFPRRSGQ